MAFSSFVCFAHQGVSTAWSDTSVFEDSLYLKSLLFVHVLSLHLISAACLDDIQVIKLVPSVTSGF